MNKKYLLALLATFTATTIYGLNHTIAKVVMPEYIQGFGFIMLRLLGATLLFWISSLFIPREKIERTDWLRLGLCAFFGMCLNMLSFFKGLEFSTPINSGVIVGFTPIGVLILSVLFLKERITLLKVSGILLGFIGGLVLILTGGTQLTDAPNIPLGNILFFVNASSFACYLVLIKPLSQKYHVITLMKWMFSLGLLLSWPITVTEFSEVAWNSLPWEVIWRMGFVVLCTTYMTYLLNVYALQTVPPSTAGVFIYLQPIIAIAYALWVGADQLTPMKILACLLIFGGVYMVSKRSKKLLKA